jgi:hypothetical protein
MSARAGAALGLLIMLVMALWFLPGVADNLHSGGDAIALSSRLLAALLVVRALTLLTLGWSVSYSLEPRRAAAALMLVCAMAWPLVLIAYLSGDVAAMRVIGAEGVLLALAGAIGFSAQLLRRLPETAELRRTLALTLGIGCAAWLWQARDLYLDWLQP